MQPPYRHSVSRRRTEQDALLIAQAEYNSVHNLHLKPLPTGVLPWNNRFCVKTARTWAFSARITVNQSSISITRKPALHANGQFKHYSKQNCKDLRRKSEGGERTLCFGNTAEKSEKEKKL
jgi:hypothetical protein